MKVLIIQGGFGAGGAEKIVAMIAAHRAQLGDEVHVAAMTCPAEGSYFDYPADVTLHVLDPDQGGARRGGLTVLRRISALRRLIRQHAPDVVLSFLTKINVQTLIASVGTGTPVIVSERNNVRAQSSHPFWRSAQGMLMPRAAQIVMQTDRACRDVPGRARAKTRVIPNPCAAQTGLAEPDTNQPPKVVAVGRLSHQKGFDLLLQAMASVTTRCPDLRLVIYGEGEARQDLEAQRTLLGLGGVVAFPGKSSAPGSWIAGADMLVLPSRYEGFPNVVAEALVNGRPVIAFDCDFGPRELIENGVNGMLVPPGDVAALAAGLEKLATSPDLRRSMGRRAAALQDRLNPDVILAAWDAVIADACGAARPTRTNDHMMRPLPQSER